MCEHESNAHNCHQLPLLLSAVSLSFRPRKSSILTHLIASDDEVGSGALPHNGVDVDPAHGMHGDVPDLVQRGVARVVVEQDEELPDRREGAAPVAEVEFLRLARPAFLALDDNVTRRAVDELHAMGDTTGRNEVLVRQAGGAPCGGGRA